MRKIQEIRLMRQQTELLRQQTEALRQQNQQQQPDLTVQGYTGFAGPDLGLAMVTMPKPTGNTKRDQRSWAKWLAKRDSAVQAAIPSWSPEAYEQVRKMAIDQAMKVRMN